MPEEPQKGTKIQLAVAIGNGLSVRAWARANSLPRVTAQRWSKDPKVRQAAEQCRRRAIDRAVGQMSSRATWVVRGITRLAGEGESESVRLRAYRALMADMMAVSRFGGLEDRMTDIEKRLAERNGNANGGMGG
jgi:hypothetical protein